ncbi:hypothetical protein [Mesorhizobium sp. M0814]|uniref:ATP-dependent DNA ligase n=1 Tax=unclassified Mesorhizobium TaxID=325217 RepID=UPI003338527C
MHNSQALARSLPTETQREAQEALEKQVRPQIIVDAGGVRIFTRRGLDWTSKYRDLSAMAKTLDVENAIIDGEIIVLNDKGLSDFAELRKASTRRQHDLYFVAFDLLHLNGHDLRDMAVEERREMLAGVIPPEIRIQFSQALPGEANAIYHVVDQAGLEAWWGGRRPTASDVPE